MNSKPVFAWWISWGEKKREVILKIKRKYWQQTHKYSIRMPKTVQETYDTDKATGNTLLGNGIKEEIKNNKTAVKESDDKPGEVVRH